MSPRSSSDGRAATALHRHGPSPGILGEARPLMRLHLLQREQKAHEDSVWCLAWGKDARVFATGSVDERATLWSLEVSEGPGSDVPTASISRTNSVTGHTLGVVSVDIEASGALAATTALDSVLRIIDVSNPAACRPVGVLEGKPMHLWQAAFDPTGTRVLAAGGSACALHVVSLPADLARAEQPVSLSLDSSIGAYAEGDAPPENEFALSVACSRDGRRAAVGCMSGTISIFDVERGQLLRQIKRHSKPVRTLCFSRDSKYLYSGSDDMHINVADAEGGSHVSAMTGHSSWVLSLDLHPEGQALLSGGADSKVKLWDLRQMHGACAQTCSDHAGHVWAVKFSADGQRAASGAACGSVAVYGFAP